MQIIILSSVFIAGVAYDAGTILTVSAADGELLIGIRRAATYP